MFDKRSTHTHPHTGTLMSQLRLKTTDIFPAGLESEDMFRFIFLYFFYGVDTLCGTGWRVLDSNK